MAGAFNWNGPTPMGIAAYVQQSGDYGRQRGEDSRLARLVSGAMADPSKRQSNIAEIASFRPEAAFQAQDQFNSQDDRKYAELGKRAAVLAGAPEAMRGQVWAQLRPELESQFGMTGLPADVTPEVIQTAQQLARVYGDDKSSELPSDIRTLRMLQDDPSLLATNDRYRGTFRFDQQFDAQGNPIYNALNNRTGEAAPADVVGAVRGGGGNAAPAPADAPTGSPAPSRAGQMPDVSDLVGNGVVMTSWSRSPADNARVGGQANSRHLEGQGVDFVVPQAQKAAWTQRAQAKGLQVIDEGDHMHVQVPRGNARGAPVLGQSDADRAAAAAQKVAAEETMRRQIDLQYAGPEADAAAEAARKKKEAELLAERNATADKRSGQAQDTLSTLNDVIAILPNATGSKLGAVRDSVLAAGGVSTEGAQASAQLRLLAAKLIANVPRFEGPQSNIDVQFYREAAGDLANEQLPVDTRLAAAQKMKEIAQRYANSGSQPAPAAAPANGGWGMTRVK